MSEVVDIRLNLDASDYAAGAGIAGGATTRLIAGQSELQNSANLTSSVLKKLIPGGALASFVGFTAAAAAAEQRLGQMQGTARITGQDMAKLTTGMNSLARSFPLGNRGAQELVQSLQQAGLSAKGQEAKIVSLGRTVTQLGAATGSNAPMIGRQLIQLNRSFGNVDLDPKRFSNMADVLTTLSAKSGASAESITSFSQQIAPLARSTGLGQAAVLGISTSFSKLGEDGLAATTAMNKMLGDLNRSVRDGSSDMNAYANIVGMTSKEFKGLFQQDPAQALTKITEAVGRAGPGRGQRLLEEIGIEGVRGQKAFGALTQSGGLQGGIDEAIKAYGSGSTKKASDAALDGLGDSATKLAASAEQIAVAFGTPLLGVVTKFTDAMAGATGQISKVANSGVASVAIKALAALGAAASLLAAGFALRKFVTGAAGVAQLGFNNAPVQAFRAEARLARNKDITQEQRNLLQMSRNDTNVKRQERIERLRASVLAGTAVPSDVAKLKRLEAAGVQGGVKNLTARAAAAGRAFGETRQTFESQRPPGVGIGTQIANYGRLVNEGYQRMMTDTSQQLKTPLGQRLSNLRTGVDLTGKATGEGSRGVIGQFNSSMKLAAASGLTFGERVKAVGGAMAKANSSIAGTDTALKAFRNSLMVTGKSLTANAGTALGAVGKAGKALTGLVGPQFLAITAGFAAIGAIKKVNSANKATEDYGSISSTSDTYAEAMGSAIDATQSFAAQAQTAAKSLANLGKDDPLTVSDAERTASREGEILSRYAGSAGGVSAAINAQFLSRGASDSDLSAITTDLLRSGQNKGQGFSEEEVQKILSRVVRTKNKSSGEPTGQANIDYKALFSDASDGDNGFKVGAFRTLTGAEGQDANPGFLKGILQSAASIPTGALSAITNRTGLTNVGGRLNPISASDEDKERIKASAQGIGQQREKQGYAYGTDYATQEAFKGVNEAAKAVLATNDKDLIGEFSKEFSKNVLGTAKGVVAKPEDIDQYGFVQAIAMKDKGFGRTVGDLESRGGSLNGGSGLSATSVQSDLSKALQGLVLFGQAASNSADDMKGDVNKAFAAFRDLPGDLGLFTKAVNTAATAAMTLEGGLDGVQAAALETMNRIGQESSPDYQVAQGVLQETQRRQSNASIYGGSGGQIATAFKQGLTQTQQTFGQSPTKANVDQFNQGRDQMFAQVQTLYETMKQRTMAAIQFFTNQTRAEKAQALQRQYGVEDYERNISNTKYDYGIQRQRSDANFKRQTERQEQSLQRQLGYGDKDFAKQRLRGQEEFNRQLRRANEAAAKSMYDPYKRIQVQAVYDLSTLMVNLREQNKALQDQATNLDRIRKAGVTNNVIDQLGLNKSENAQQLARLLADVERGGEDAAKRLNDVVAERMKAAGTLNSDSSNKDLANSLEDFRRQQEQADIDYNEQRARQLVEFGIQTQQTREDYKRSIGEMDTDFRLMLKRAGDNQDRLLTRMNEAFALSQKQARQDFDLSMKEITGSFESVQKAMQDAMNGNISTGSGLLKNTIDEAIKVVTAGIKQLGSESAAAFTEAGALAARFASDNLAKMSQARIDNEFQAQNPAGYRGAPILWPGAAPKAATPLTGNTTLERLLNSLAGPGGTISKPSGTISKPTGSKYYGMAEGGVVTQATKVLLGEARDNEAIIPLNAGGMNMLGEAMGRYMSEDTMTGMSTSSARSHIVYSTTNNNYDNSTQVTGAIQVVSNDPLDMARQLQAKARRDNLSSTPTQRSRR